MKIRKLLFLSIFLILGLVLFMPNTVNAENSKGYNVEVKKLEDYVCEELKGHELSISVVENDRFAVYDEDTEKQYWIELSNLGVCKEYEEEPDDKNYIPTEYSWDENNLYLETYSSNYLFVHAKTLDKEIQPGSSYAELGQDGYYHVSEPTNENISNYYESYFFEKATGEYDENASYYEIKQYHYSNGDYNADYELATLVELEETTYEADKYYVIAKPIKRDLIGQFDSDSFVVSTEESGFTSDLSLSKNDFSYHFVFGNKTYYIFNLRVDNFYYLVFLDEEGNFQNFGLDNVLVVDKSVTNDDENISILVKSNNKYYILILDKDLKQIVKHEVNNNEAILIGKNDNTFYYLTDHMNNKFLEISYLEQKETDEFIIDFTKGTNASDLNITESQGKVLEYLIEEKGLLIVDEESRSFKNKDGKILFTIDEDGNLSFAEGLTTDDNIIYDLNEEEQEEFKKSGINAKKVSIIVSTKEVYKVVFDANGGFFKNDIKTIDIEDIINFDYDAFEKPTRKGYKFIGFYTKDGKSYLEVMNSEAGINEDTTFYAGWEKVSSDGVQSGIPESGEQGDNNTGNTESGNTNTDNTNTNKPTGKNPQTGDNLILFVTIFVISIIGFTTVTKMRKKANNN